MSLSADNHPFVDAYGDVTPAEQLRAAWSGYFKFMPEYAIQVDDVICDGETAAVFGSAHGSLAPSTVGGDHGAAPPSRRLARSREGREDPALAGLCRHQGRV